MGGIRMGAWDGWELRRDCRGGDGREFPEDREWGRP